MSKGHRHAALMAEYARIAAGHEKPWCFLEYLDESGKWLALDTHPEWGLDTEYRLKTCTIRIGDIDVPEPMRSAPEVGSSYFIINLIHPNMVVECEWDGSQSDAWYLARGICHPTEEAAIAHAKALILVSGGKEG